MILGAGIIIGDTAKATFVDSNSFAIDPAAIDIDFREGAPSWGTAAGPNAAPTSYSDNLHTFGQTVDGTNLFSSGNPFVTASAFKGTSNAKLYWDSKDGYGVVGGENDEINGSEYMTVTFSIPVMLEGVFLTDLFKAPDGGVDGEAALVQLFMGATVVGDYIFTSTNALGVNNGEAYGAFGINAPNQHAVQLDKVIFTSTNQANDEYSVAGFRGYPVSVVPLPAALPLYGTGLAVMGLIGWHKRRKAAAA